MTVGELDRSLILHAGELDRLCAHAVCILARRAHAPVLDVLGALNPERLIAVYYALPQHRRAVVRRDPAWAYHIEHAPQGTAEAVADTQRLAQETQEITANLRAPGRSGTLRGSPTGRAP